MPFATTNSFLSTPLPKIALLISQDPYDKDEIVSFIKKQGLSSITYFDIQDAATPSLNDAFFSISFFSKESEELIVLENIDKLSKEQNTLLEQFFALQSQKTLLATTTSLTKTSSIYKLFEKCGVVIDTSLEKPWEKQKTCAEWIRAHLRERGKKIDKETIDFFSKEYPHDRYMLHNELEKLIAFVDTKETISYKDFLSISCTDTEKTIWQLQDALFAQEKERFFLLLHDIEAQDVHPLIVLKNFKTALTTMYIIADHLEQGTEEQAIRKEAPQLKGSLFDKTVARIKTLGKPVLQKLLMFFDKEELLAKNTEYHMTNRFLIGLAKFFR